MKKEPWAKFINPITPKINVKPADIKNSISPLDFEYNKIQDLLLNRKKLDFLKKIEDDLYQNALNSKKIKIYQ